MLGAIPATQDNLKQIATNVAQKYGVDPALVFAHIQVESSWNPQAYRSEPQINDASWGLMQLLLKTARSISGNSSLTASELLNPETNIDLGTRYIAQQMKRYNNNVDDAIAAYNAGSARRKSDGIYINQDYVDKVNKWYKIYKAEGYVTSIATAQVAGLPLAAIVAFGAVLGLLLI